MTAVRDSTHSTRYVVATADCTAGDLASVGGKAIGLGRLVRAGQRVPRSFVVTAAAYLEYVRSVDEAGVATLPAGLGEEVASAYRALCDEAGASDVAVAVRSSATIEDSTEASCAGQFRTFLGASGSEEVLREVERCFLSAFEPHVDSYRSAREVAEKGNVAVVVQELIDSRVSGVMFTRHPRTGDPSLVVVEASYGLGESVVGGEVTPDLFELNKVTGQLHASSRGTKRSEHRLSHDHHLVVESEVDEARRDAWSLGDAELHALLDMGADLERNLGKGLDIEWAIGTPAGSAGQEELFLLQVRPITVDPRRSRAGVSGPHNPIDHVLGRLAGREG